MSEQYTRDLLRVAVAQICQTIGYNATQSSSLELLQDLLHRFLNEFSRDLRRQVEHDNRTSACLEDVARTFSSLNISLHELVDYIGNVESVPFVTDVPKFPVNKPSNLNFLKPGSKEVLSRPVHIFEHLPPMLPPDTPQPYTNEGNNSALQNKPLGSFGTTADSNELSLLAISEENKIASSSSSSMMKIKSEPDNERTKLDINIPTNSSILPSAIAGKSLQMMDEHGRRTREIVSVVMTTGGFISPAIEGKLPEYGIPAIVEKFLGLDAPPPPTPPPPPEPVPTIDVATKPEKHALESSSKSTTGKEILSGTTKKNAPNVDNREKNNTVVESGSTEMNISPKKNSSKQNLKKTPFVQPNQAQQPIALKLLKKAKKKNTGLPPNPTDTMSSNIEEVLDQNSDKLSEKARRKKLKMLQKMLKNPHTLQGVTDSKKEQKKMKSLPNAHLFSEMPAGMERVRMDKMLKKQAKQKQKQLKKQQTLEAQRNNFSESVPSQAHFDGISGFGPLKPPTQQMEGVAQKIEQKYDIKTANFDVPNVPLQSIPSFDKTSILPNAEHAQVETLSFAQTQSNLMPPEKTSALEIKLSNEPDRNKLNIFKKISKGQKGAQLTPPSKQALPSNSFTGSEGQIINLPSGTTITPAPLPFSTPGNLIPSKNNYPEGLLEGSVEPTTLNLTTTTQPEIVNKPKKRGRKPGSKNQPKVLLNGPLAQEQNLNPGQVKKQKKMKIPNAVKQGHMPDSLAHNLAGSALGFPKFDSAAMLGQGPFPNAPTQIFSAPPPLKAQRKERKEKDKSKPLDMFPNFSDLDAVRDIKPEHTSPVNLSGIHLNPLLFNSNIEQNISPKQKPRKRPANQAKNSKSSATMLPTFLSGPQASPGFPQLSTNMLSMLPFPFPPRPGLIPAPGLFPGAPGLTNFPSQLSNPASTTSNAAGLLGLGPPFFPFPTMKPQTVPLMNQSQDRNLKDRLKEPPANPTPYPIDRSYCNVAPLVPPDSIKQVTETSGSPSNPLLATAKHHQKNLGVPGKMSLIDTQVNVSEDNPKDIFIPNMGPGFPPNLKYEAAASSLLRKATMTAAAQSLNNPTLAINEVKANDKYAPTGGADDPIEVSDDSDETPIPPDGPSRNPFNSMALPLLKAPQLANPALVVSSSLPNTVVPTDLPINLADSKESDMKIIAKDAKKLKKVQKHNKKNTKIGEPDSVVGSSLDVFNPSANCPSVSGSGSDGFSKLAGGADLIPLTGTGSAYSARSIPSTSLTGSRPLNLNISTFEQTRKELAGEPEKRFSDVTIIPNILKKKSKEHKKLRKLKDGDGIKIKKKKDKKDKVKDKEILEFALGQETSFEKRGDKEALKKLKKEKKKQKQRLSANPNEPPQAHFQSIPSNTQIPINMFGNLSESSSSLAQSTPPTVLTTVLPSASSDSTAPSLVPKITLKIGSSQSPTPVTAKVDTEVVKIATPKREPSPELARFSPLVTRPPKQKLTQTDSSMTSLTTPNSENKPTMNIKPADNIAITPQPVIPPPSPWLPGGTLTASSVLLPQQLMTNAAAKPKVDQHLHQNPTSKMDVSLSGNSNAPRSGNAVISNNQNPVPLIAETNRPSSYVDAEGNTVWICPACGKVDDGSPMIGCDGCDAWYHWECVGIAVAPNDNEDWFCRVCITRKKGFHSGGEGTEKKRKRNKKK